jgi:hypothetical protein
MDADVVSAPVDAHPAQDGGARKSKSKSKHSKGKKPAKRGGNIVSDLSKLAVPLGLLFAKKSLESFLKKRQSAKPKASRPSTRKYKLRGGEGEGEVSGALAQEVHSQPAPVGGAKKRRSLKKKKAVKKGGEGVDGLGDLFSKLESSASALDLPAELKVEGGKKKSVKKPKAKKPASKKH